MSNSLLFYQDAGLTVSLSRIDALQASDGNAVAVDRVIYLGSTVSGKKFQDAVDPGAEPIVLSVVDSLTGLQVPSNTLRLALSGGGLDAATPGAAINLGTELLSGTGNALPVHVRVDAIAIAAGAYDNLSLVTSDTMEISA